MRTIYWSSISLYCWPSWFCCLHWSRLPCWARYIYFSAWSFWSSWPIWFSWPSLHCWLFWSWKSFKNDMSRNMRFPTMWYMYVRPAKAQTSLRIRPVWSKSLLVAWILYECYATCTDWTSFRVSKLKRRVHRLVWVYTCQNATLLKITCHDSYAKKIKSATRYT